MADRYLSFDREEWADLRAATPLTLRQEDLDSLQGINERIDIDEVVAVYLPLSRLLNLYVSGIQELQRVTSTFLGSAAPRVPYVIGIVRLDEDVQMMCHMLGDHDSLACDATVEVAWAEIHGRKMPSFQVVGP